VCGEVKGCWELHRSQPGTKRQLEVARRPERASACGLSWGSCSSSQLNCGETVLYTRETDRLRDDFYLDAIPLASDLLKHLVACARESGEHGRFWFPMGGFQYEYSQTGVHREGCGAGTSIQDMVVLPMLAKALLVKLSSLSLLSCKRIIFICPFYSPASY